MTEKEEMVEYKPVQSEWLVSQEMARTYMMSAFKPSNMKVEDAMMIMETGRELGLGRMYAMQGLYPIKGKVGMKAETMLALFNTKYPNGRYYFAQRDDNACVIMIKKYADEEYQKFSYTKEEAAKTPEYQSNPNYRSRMKQMLHARCVSDTIRAIAPEVLMGLYTPEELMYFDDPKESIPQKQPFVPKELEVDTNHITNIQVEETPLNQKEMPDKKKGVLTKEFFIEDCKKFNHPKFLNGRDELVIFPYDCVKISRDKSWLFVDVQGNELWIPTSMIPDTNPIGGTNTAHYVMVKRWIMDKMNADGKDVIFITEADLIEEKPLPKKIGNEYWQSNIPKDDWDLFLDDFNIYLNDGGMDEINVYVDQWLKENGVKL